MNVWMQMHDLSHADLPDGSIESATRALSGFDWNSEIITMAIIRQWWSFCVPMEIIGNESLNQRFEAIGNPRRVSDSLNRHVEATGKEVAYESRPKKNGMSGELMSCTEKNVPAAIDNA